ncbi:MAG: metallophosphoesterase family protein [candidate division WOR-3 bacterium]|nr:MAG: metallophosphoesterase family protein [candidate division WOR-3 bacterium]
MKIIGLTDIHGRTGYPETLVKQMRSADVIAIAGDITNFGGYSEAGAIIETIASTNGRIIAVHGNCDKRGVVEFLSARQINIHALSRIVDDVQFLGLGGSNKTPFHTPHEYDDEETKEILEAFPQSPRTRFHMLISHAPPFKSKLDRMFLGLHVGSKPVREYIEAFQPDIVLCGHIHEARGIDHIGKTLIINPGPFPKHYVVIDIDKEIAFTLY